MVEKHGEHPLAIYAKLVRGINASRDFKKLSPTKKLTVRKAHTEDATATLGTVIEELTGDRGIDNITLNMVLRRLARTEMKAGNAERGNATLDRMVEIFRKKGVNNHVMRQVQAQARVERKEMRRS